MSLPLWIRGIIVTAMAFAISWITVYDLMSISFFSPMEKAADFRFSDFYTLVANDRAVKSLHPAITIVNIDGCRRNEIATTLEDIDYCMPAAIGLDVVFSEPRDTAGDLLSEVIAEIPDLILPVVAKDAGNGRYTIGHESYYDRFAPPAATFAAANVEGEGEARHTVRQFMPLFPSATPGEPPIPSLAYALVAKKSPEIAGKINHRGCNDEALRYASRYFDIVDHDSVLHYPEKIEDKIVIVGKLHDIGDLHATPLNNFTPGVLLHAYAAATMLDGDLTRRLSTRESWFIAGIACYLVVLLSLKLSQHSLGDLIVRGAQLAALYLMITGGTMIYIRYNIDLDFANAMLMTSLGVVACDLFNGIFADDGIIISCRKKFLSLIIYVKTFTNELYKKCSFKNLDASAANDDRGISGA